MMSNFKPLYVKSAALVIAVSRVMLSSRVSSRLVMVVQCFGCRLCLPNLAVNVLIKHEAWRLF